jgi:hypothetical protein
MVVACVPVPDVRGGCGSRIVMVVMMNGVIVIHDASLRHRNRTISNHLCRCPDERRVRHVSAEVAAYTRVQRDLGMDDEPFLLPPFFRFRYQSPCGANEAVRTLDTSLRLKACVMTR